MPLLFQPIVQILTPDTGEPFSGAKATFFTTGTLTTANVYEDNALTTPHDPNDITADANGVMPSIYLDPAVTYRMQIRSPSGALLYDKDPITGGASIGTDDLTDDAVTTDKIADQAVTNSKLAPQAVANENMEDMPASTIKANATGSAAAPQDISPRALNKMLRRIGRVTIVAGGDADPDLELLCNGAAVSRTTYADLFAVIGTKHGSGDGSTTFNLPDYRGVVLRGRDRGRGYDKTPNRDFGSYQADDNKSHFHTAELFNGPGGDGGNQFSSYGSLNSDGTGSTAASGAVEVTVKNSAVDFVIYW